MEGVERSMVKTHSFDARQRSAQSKNGEILDQGRPKPRSGWMHFVVLLAMLFHILALACGGPTGDSPNPAPSLLDPLGSVEPDAQPGGPLGDEGSTVGEAPEAPSDMAFVILSAPSFCCSDLNYDFSVQTASGDPPPAGITWTWDFGDGRTGSGAEVSHTFTAYGTFELTVTGRWADGTQLSIGKGLTIDSGTSGPLATGIVADAGENQVAVGGALVTLDGRGSLVAGDAATYRWRQLQGEAVALKGSNLPTATFVAPEASSEAQTLTFELAVSDEEGDDTDAVSVVVLPSPAAPPGEPPGGGGGGGGGGGSGGLPGGGTSNHAPIAHDGAATVSKDGSVELTLTATDEDGDDLTFFVDAFPAHGLLGPIDNGGLDTATVTYTPAAGYSGKDQFHFRAEDKTASSAKGTFDLDVVLRANAPPETTDQRYLVPVGTESALTVAGTDADRDALTFRILAGPRSGKLKKVEATGPEKAKLIYVPSPGFHGEDEIVFEAYDGKAASEPARVSITVNKLLIPWLEMPLPLDDALNYFPPERGAKPGMTVLEFQMKGIKDYAKVTNTILITTGGSQLPNLFNNLNPVKPKGLRVVGGIKTANILGYDDFASEEGWRAIRDRALLCEQLSDVKAFGLENETALERFHKGEVRIDFDRLSRSLAPLAETDIEFWWWFPLILSDTDNFPNRHDESVTLLRTVLEAVPKSRFITGYTGTYDWEKNAYGEVTRRNEFLAEIGQGGLWDRHLTSRTGYMDLGGSPRRVYTAQESVDSMRKLGGSQFSLYSGSTYWNWLAEDYAQVLPRIAETQPPY